MRSAWEIKHYSKSDTIIFTHGYTRQISKGDLDLDLDHKYNKAKMKLNDGYYEITFSDPKDKASDVKRVTVRIASKNYTIMSSFLARGGTDATSTMMRDLLLGQVPCYHLPAHVDVRSDGATLRFNIDGEQRDVTTANVTAKKTPVADCMRLAGKIEN